MTDQKNIDSIFETQQDPVDEGRRALVLGGAAFGVSTILPGPKGNIPPAGGYLVNSEIDTTTQETVPPVISEFEDPQVVRGLVNAYKNSLELSIRLGYKPEARRQNEQYVPPTTVLKRACFLAEKYLGVQDLRCERSGLYKYLSENTLSTEYLEKVNSFPDWRKINPNRIQGPHEAQRVKEIVKTLYSNLLNKFDPVLSRFYVANELAFSDVPEIYRAYLGEGGEEAYFSRLFDIYEESRGVKSDLSMLLAFYIRESGGDVGNALFDLMFLTEAITRYNYHTGVRFSELSFIGNYAPNSPTVPDVEKAIARINEFGDPFSKFDAPYGLPATHAGFRGIDAHQWSRIGTLYHVCSFMQMLPHFPPHIIQSLAIGEFSNYGGGEHGPVKLHSDAAALLDLDNAGRFLNSLNK